MRSYVFDNFHSFLTLIQSICPWDLETSGLKGAKSGYVQPLQYGLIELDEELRYLKEYEERCKINDYTTQEPEGLLITRNVRSLTEGPSEYEMMQNVDKIISSIKQKGYMIGVTYNGDGYDEAILQHARHRNLLSPYVTSTNGSGKLDLLTSFKLLANVSDVNFPINEKGNLSLKLVKVAEVFGISPDGAHDALFDSRMLYELLKVLKKEFPEVYHSGLVNASKAGSLEMLKHSEDYLLLGQVFGKTFTTPIAYCGQGMIGATANTVAMFDLNFDPKDIINLSEYELREDAIGGSGSPIKTVQINKTVPVLPIGSIKDPDALFDISHSELCKRAKVIKTDPSFHERVSNILSGKTYPKKTPKSSEEAIYDSFTSKEDITYGEGFSLADNCQRWGMVNNFQDPRWREFSKRILVAQDFDNAPDVAKNWYLNFVDKRLHSNGFGMNNEEALNQTIDLLEDASGDDKRLLMTLKSFLEGRIL